MGVFKECARQQHPERLLCELARPPPRPSWFAPTYHLRLAGASASARASQLLPLAKFLVFGLPVVPAEYALVGKTPLILFDARRGIRRLSRVPPPFEISLVRGIQQ